MKLWYGCLPNKPMVVPACSTIVISFKDLLHFQKHGFANAQTQEDTIHKIQCNMIGPSIDLITQYNIQ